MPRDLKQAQHDLRLDGLALAACEKAVQLVYETTLRPEGKQYASVVPAEAHPALVAHGSAAESLPAFRAFLPR